MNIDHLSYEELADLNRRVVQRLRQMQGQQRQSAMLAFQPGDMVSFDTDRGRKIAVMVKYNQKTVTILTNDGERWNVSPSLLTKVRSVKSQNNQVIDVD
jgi:hypothetical protein